MINADRYPTTAFNGRDSQAKW